MRFLISSIKYHVIWVTKYRYKVSHGPIAIRTRELIRQGESLFCKEV
ncbi:transposase [Sporosarcina sp. YIM B06819]